VLLAGCSGGDNPSAFSSSPPTTPGAPASGPFNQGFGFNGSVNRIVLAQDGTGDIYVGGQFTAYKGTIANRLIRLHSDGTVAKTFGLGFDNLIDGLALAKTGRGELYVQGGFTRFDGQPVPPLIRLTPTGSLDAGFRLDTAFSRFGLGPFFGPFLVVAAEDGSEDLYVMFDRPNPNSTSPGDHTLRNIARLNADGTVDPAFSTGNGLPTGSGMGDPQIISDLLPTSSGKLYVGGGMSSFNGLPVSSLIRLNSDGTLDPTFIADVGGPPSSGVPKVLDIEPAGDGTSDLYAGTWVDRLIRVHESGAFDTSFKAELKGSGGALAVAEDGSGDVLLAPLGAETLFRFNRSGGLVSAPAFITPTSNGTLATIVPLQDGTGDLYIGGNFTTYNGAAVNHFARIHADGSLASVVN
jgi:hypothetical protein